MKIVKNQISTISKSVIFIFFMVMQFFCIHAQTVIHIDSKPESRKEISPLIYGLNPYHYDPVKRGMNLHDEDINVTALRFGGDAVSTYNWEINRSTHNNSCGDVGRFDWLPSWRTYFNNFNGNFVNWASNTPKDWEDLPGGAKLQLVQDANDIGAYPLLQISALDNVSSEKMGCLANMDSEKFKSVIYEKSVGNLSLSPDLSDEFVYADEEINYLIDLTGGSQSQGGIRGYCLENEPALWRYTHPYVKPVSPTLGEILNMNITLAKRVKVLDPGAETFGLGAYGFMEFANGVQDIPATDYNEYMHVPGYTDKAYKNMRWIAAYLHQMKKQSDLLGIRLLDVLDIHFYNEGDDTEFNPRQDSRSFWDTTYQEESWITKYILFEPYDVANTFHKLIRDFYPGTKLGITEWGHLNNNHNNAIYMADMLGAFGMKDVYLATYFGRLTGNLSGAFRMYTNYDGNNNRFGGTGVSSSSSDNSLVTAYASLDNNTEKTMHVMLINRSESQQDISLLIDAPIAKYQSAEIFWLSPSSGGKIERLQSLVNIQNNTISYSLAPGSIYHLVLEDPNLVSVNDVKVERVFYPNPANDFFYISDMNTDIHIIKILDINGKTVKEITNPPVSEAISTKGLDSGIYLLMIQDQSNMTIQKMVIQK